MITKAKQSVLENMLTLIDEKDLNKDVYELGCDKNVELYELVQSTLENDSSAFSVALKGSILNKSMFTSVSDGIENVAYFRIPNKLVIKPLLLKQCLELFRGN